MHVPLPKIPAGLKTTITDRQAIKSEAKFERVILRGIDAIQIDAQKLRFDEAAVDRVILIQAALDGIRMMDTEVRGCDMSAAVCIEGSFNRVRFTHCRLAGIDFSHCDLKQVIFEDCKLDMANFRFANLSTVRFEKCTFSETDFQLSTLSTVEFNDCQLEQTNFAQSRSHDVDLRSSQITAIRGWQHLKGAAITYEQLLGAAPYLAAELGLHVKD